MGHILAFLMKTLLMPMTSINISFICHGELMKILTKKLLAKKLLAKKLLQAHKKIIMHFFKKRVNMV